MNVTQMTALLRLLKIQMTAPSELENYKVQLEKMRSLSEAHEKLIEGFLRGRSSATGTLEHGQEYLCFHRTMEVLKASFKEFLKALCPRLEGMGEGGEWEQCMVNFQRIVLECWEGEEKQNQGTGKMLKEEEEGVCRNQDLKLV